ncbi:leucine-responsive regulatory protein [archaeon]|nr:leucine-responsive regulatory protein [archaeon]
MDNTDREIINILIENSRTSYKDIASKVGISDVAVNKRVKKLERDVINGFIPLVKQGAFNLDITCIVSIKCSPGDKQRIAEDIAGFSDVYEVYTTIGEHDIIAKIRTEDTSTLKNLVDGKISRIKGINEIRSSIVFNCFKEKVWLVI